MSVMESAWPMMECTPQQQLRNGELVICSHYMSCQVFALYWKICFSSRFSWLIVSPRKISSGGAKINMEPVVVN